MVAVPRVAASVDIIVPVFNEVESIDEFYQRVRRLGYADRLLFVDNASTDGTVDRIRRHPDVRLIRHERNEGYGASIRDGIAASEGEYIIILDADLEYPPEAIPAILDALAQHAVVYGSRFLAVDPPPMPLPRRVGNRLASALFNTLFRQHTSDVYTGMKGFQRSALPLARLRRNGFEHGVEIAALIAMAGQRIHDVPIGFRSRRQGRSKMSHLPETLKLAAYLVAYRVCGARLLGEPPTA